jgi:small subunit ribosomal protein S3
MAAEKKLVKNLVTKALLDEYIQKEVERSGFGGMKIQRGPLSTNIVLTVQKPGLVIGRKGSSIAQLTKKIGEKFGLENPVIEIEDVKDPSLNPDLMAYQLSRMLKRGWNYRRASYTVVSRIMEAGAKGCEVIVSGKLTSQRHRTLKIISGYIKHSGEAAKTLMKKGFTEAKLKPGIIGIYVAIMSPDAAPPDQIKEKKKEIKIEETVEEKPGEEQKTQEKKEEKSVEKEKEPSKEDKKNQSKKGKKPAKIPVDQIPDLSPSVVKKLVEGKLDTYEKLETVDYDSLIAVKGIGEKTAKGIIEAVKKMKEKKEVKRGER